MTNRSPLAMTFLLGASLILTSTTACTTNPFGPTTDTVSSTSGKTWFTEDGLMKSDLKPAAFVTFNYDNLRRDIAAGEGEYLTSVSVLLGVPPHRQPDFFSAIQSHAIDTAVSAANPELLLASLRQTALPYLR